MKLGWRGELWSLEKRTLRLKRVVTRLIHDRMVVRDLSEDEKLAMYSSFEMMMDQRIDL